MKRLVYLSLPFIASLASAQDYRGSSALGSDLRSRPMEVPEVVPVVGLPSDATSHFLGQDSRTLTPVNSDRATASERPEWESIRQPSTYAIVVSNRSIPVSSVRADQLRNDLQRVSAAYREAGAPEVNCARLGLSVESRAKADPDNLLEIVNREILANGSCACEIVKAAIDSSDREVSTVVAIVESAIGAKPDAMRMIAQCAIASCPDALAAVQEVLARYDMHSGESASAKSAKSAKGEKAAITDEPGERAPIANPLDFPGYGPVGPTPGGPGGNFLFPMIPPVVIVTDVTEVNP